MTEGYVILRSWKIYVLILFVIVALGLPARTVSRHLPTWYVNYAGDLLWAMLVFFLFALVMPRLRTVPVMVCALAFAYGIEVSQLFHPSWLDAIRSYKLCALVLGHGFLWSDIAAYTAGISLAALIDRWITRSSFLSADRLRVECGGDR